MSINSLILLLAEDNEDDALFFRRCFRQFEPEWRLEWANDGAKAWEFCQRSGFPHVIVTDLNMPLMGGLELIRQCRAHPEGVSVPILAYSSFCKPEMKQACLEAGANETGIKGCSSGELKDVLQRLLSTVKTPSP